MEIYRYNYRERGPCEGTSHMYSNKRVSLFVDRIQSLGKVKIIETRFMELC